MSVCVCVCVCISECDQVQNNLLRLKDKVEKIRVRKKHDMCEEVVDYSKVTSRTDEAKVKYENFQTR